MGLSRELVSRGTGRITQTRTGGGIAGMAPRGARHLPIGAEVRANGAHFRVWAPERSQVDAVIEKSGVYPLKRDAAGYHEGFVEGVKAGALYRYRLDGGNTFPDPASRFQPEGVHGPSQIVDPSLFRWTDSQWNGLRIKGQILYEMHIGTFTPEGTWASAMAELSRLAELGVTVVEVMPVAAFPGRFGWGYDGVFWFAPTPQYGTPEEFRAFVDRAHSLSLGVILDVVYNHLGPDGNYLREFSPYYFSDQNTDWGIAINYDGKHSESVRELVISNARYWIEEFHLDGLRLDATQQIFDRSGDHIVAAIAREARQSAGSKSIIIVTENEPNNLNMVRSVESEGFGLDGLWNDDFHHSTYVSLTGHNEAYYSDYHGSPQEFVSTAKYGCLYQGQIFSWQKKRRGTAGLDIPPAAMITFLENHDQIANSAEGHRLRSMAHPGSYRALTAFLLLTPGTPMLFQGQEYGASTPFPFFADHHSELAPKVREGRFAFLAQFPSFATPEVQARIPIPDDPQTFERSKLRREETDETILALYRDLLEIRRSDPAFSAQRARGVDGAVLSPEAFVLRFFNGSSGDRLLVINLGTDLDSLAPSEPLLAPPANTCWKQLWSSQDPRYGGPGTPPVETLEGWRIPGHSAIVFGPIPVDQSSVNDS